MKKQDMTRLCMIAPELVNSIHEHLIEQLIKRVTDLTPYDEDMLSYLIKLRNNPPCQIPPK